MNNNEGIPGATKSTTSYVPPIRIIGEIIEDQVKPGYVYIHYHSGDTNTPAIASDIEKICALGYDRPAVMTADQYQDILGKMSEDKIRGDENASILLKEVKVHECSDKAVQEGLHGILRKANAIIYDADILPPGEEDLTIALLQETAKRHELPVVIVRKAKLYEKDSI